VYVINNDIGIEIPFPYNGTFDSAATALKSSDTLAEISMHAIVQESRPARMASQQARRASQWARIGSKPKRIGSNPVVQKRALKLLAEGRKKLTLKKKEIEQYRGERPEDYKKRFDAETASSTYGAPKTIENTVEVREMRIVWGRLMTLMYDRSQDEDIDEVEAESLLLWMANYARTSKYARASDFVASEILFGRGRPAVLANVSKSSIENVVVDIKGELHSIRAYYDGLREYAEQHPGECYIVEGIWI
jgi:hypothetical protein